LVAQCRILEGGNLHSFEYSHIFVVHIVDVYLKKCVRKRFD
jgi:hypothetical protein